MSGHSKWAAIKRKKAKNDQARGRVFSRLAREITVACRSGGGDPELNPRLRLMLQKAKSEGMPADTIERAIKKGSGDLEGNQLEECLYEGYAPHGVALMIEALTDNRNRTVGDIRAVFNKLGGSLGESGCVGYQFETKGQVIVDPGERTEDDVLEVVLDAGAEDLKATDDGFEVLCAPEDLSHVVAALEAAGMGPSDFQLARLPSHSVSLDEHQAVQVLRLLDALEDVDDVQAIYSNFDIDESVLDAVGREG